MGKIGVIMNIPMYLSQAILDLSKIIMYEFHHDYIKHKYGVNLQSCYMDTDSLVYNIKTDDFYEDVASNVKARFNTRKLQMQSSSPHGSKQEGHWPYEGSTGWKDHDRVCGIKMEVVCL